MSYQVLARKYRPKHFHEVIGQDHIVKSITASIKSKTIAHAFLFTGTRGVGKTTVARLFANSLLCENRQLDVEPCGKCKSCLSFKSSNHLDLIEIDGASNNSVENVRDLIEKIHYLPTSGEHKIIIVDEVHMLSVSAFNALLKTLEEPPKHAVIILATTDPQKVLDTVISRCLRFDFKSMNLETLHGYVSQISKKENIKFESEEDLKTICKIGNGSARDTLSALDQALSFSDSRFITSEILSDSFGIVSHTKVTELVKSVLLGDEPTVKASLKEVLDHNVDVKKLLRQISDFLFNIIYHDGESYGLAKDELIWIFEVLNKDSQWALVSLDPTSSCKIILQKLALRNQVFSKSVPKVRTEGNQVGAKKKSQEIAKKVEPKNWSDFIKYLYKNSPAIAANVERGKLTSDFSLNIEKITLTFTEDNSMFFEYLEDHETKSRLSNILKEFLGLQDGLKIELKKINEEEKVKTGFVSNFEQEKIKEQEQIKEKKELIKNNMYVKQVESLFNVKATEIKLKD